MELARSTSHGGLSLRRIFTFVLTAIAAALLWTLFVTPPTQAAEVAWNGESIMYDGHQYLPAGEAKAGESHNLPVNSRYYVYVETIDERSQLYKAHVIYFAPGADPPAEAEATYVTYDYQGRVYSNPSQSEVVKVNAEGSTGIYPTSCAVGGIGWIVCPITVWLAQGMDFVFELLKGFIEVQPLNVNNMTNNPMQAAWNVARSIANIAFIIVFLVIIYSQLTSVGLSNYGLKKLIPRLIIAAVLVNLSYYITAIAIDISNILGYSVQDIFIQLREDVFVIDGDTWSADMYSWESVSGVVLSGGTAGLAAGVGLGGALLVTGGDLIGLAVLLIPVLLGLLLAVLVVFLILAARQAIIILLVIIAPLAFVAYLLPNTEKLFEKWRGLFTTMLVFFPAFSLVFGGSQLAGGLIIQNANSWNVVILGMIVQVAPLVITPLLLKLSGSLLARIAGIVNDPSKGLIDRTRNWAKGEAEYRKYKKFGREGGLRKSDLVGRAVRGYEARQYKRARSTERGKQIMDNYFKDRMLTSPGGQSIEVSNELAKRDSHEMDQRLKAGVDEMLAGEHKELDMLLGERKLKTASERMQYRQNYNPADRNKDIQNKRRQKFVHAAVEHAVEMNLEGRRLSSTIASADLKQQEAYSKELKANANLRNLAGGIDANGAQRALANATAALSKIREETLSNVTKIILDTNARNDEIRLLSQGISVRGIQVTQDTIAAALKMTLGSKDKGEIAKAMENVDFSFTGYPAGAVTDAEELQVIAAEALESNPDRPPQLTNGFIGLMKQGLRHDGTAFTGKYGSEGIRDMIITSVNNEKLDAGKFQTMGNDYARPIMEAIANSQDKLTPKAFKRLQRELGITLDASREASEKLGDSLSALETILDIAKTNIPDNDDDQASGNGGTGSSSTPTSSSE